LLWAFRQERHRRVNTLRETMMSQNSLLLRLLRDENGATAIEYGLIAALIAVAAIAAFQLVGTNLSSLFNTVATDL
jgi:pilus assembly protein Flp/PilA